MARNPGRPISLNTSVAFSMLMFPLILVGACFILAAFMIWLAWNLDESQQAFKFFYFGLCVLFLVYGAWQVSFLAYQPDVRLNYTEEDSLYWNCTKNVTDIEAGCSGIPTANSCDVYNINQCADIAGCVWNTDNDCIGQPEIDSCAPYTQYQCENIPSCEWTPGEEAYCFGTPESESCQPYTQLQCENIEGCWWDVVCWGAPVNCTVVGEYDITGNKCENETLGCDWHPAVNGSCSGTVDNCTQLVSWGKDKCDETVGCAWDVDTYCSGTPTVTCEWLGLYDETGYKCQETVGCLWTNATIITVNATCDSVNVTYVYGNYSSGYEPYGESMAVVATALMIVMLMLILYVMLTFAGSILSRLSGKPPKGDFVENEYGRPY